MDEVEEFCWLKSSKERLDTWPQGTRTSTQQVPKKYNKEDLPSVWLRRKAQPDRKSFVLRGSSYSLQFCALRVVMGGITSFEAIRLIWHFNVPPLPNALDCAKAEQ